MSVLQDTIKKMNRKATGQDKIFINNIYDKWLNTKICEEQSKLRGKKHNPVIKWTKHLINEGGRKQISTWKDAHHYSLGRWTSKPRRDATAHLLERLKYKISTNKI